MSRFSEGRTSLVPTIASSLVFVGAVALAGRLMAGPLARFDDIVRLEFVLLDDETSLPVKGAAVRLMDPFGGVSDNGEDVATFSDQQGRAAPSRDFNLGELVNYMRDGNRFQVIGWRLKVTADGYQTSTTPLSEHTGEVIDYRTPKVKHPAIRLRRKDAKLDSGPKCETFVYRDWALRRVSLVFYGDKFDALFSCAKLCSQHTPWFEAKLGVVKSVDGVLNLSVQGQELIRRTDGTRHEWLLNDLVRVKWGKRRYLVAREQGIAFCNAVNLGEEPRNNEYGDFALGEGQETVSVTGLPEVPEPWSHYLLKAPVRGEVTGLLPDLKAKVNVGRKQGLRAGMVLVPTEESLFDEMEIVGVEEGESVIRKKYPHGMYRKIRIGDIVSTYRPKSRVTIQKGP
jgi:hypothetical protein